MVDNVNKWYFPRNEIEENSPSRRDGVSLEKENRLRKKYNRFISETCQKFQIPKIVNATASLYCHRFFLLRSHAKHKWYRIAIACVFLASKVEDHRIRMATFQEEGWRETLKEVFKKEMSFREHRQMIVEDETEILTAINFEIAVDHPYKYFVKAVRNFNEVPVEVCQAATKFIDNSYFSSLCLQFKPQKIAGAVFHLSYKFLKLKLPFQEEEDGYREIFQMTLNELEDISSQMMDLYEYRPPPNTDPDNLGASSSSSLPGHQSLSATASTSAPPPMPAAHGNQSAQPPAEPSKQSLIVLIPRPIESGKESPTELMPLLLAPGKQSIPADTTTDNQSAPSSSSLPGDQSLSESAPAPLPATQGNQSPPPPAVPGKQSLPASSDPPAAPSKQSSPVSSLPAAPSNRKPPKPTAQPKIRLYYKGKSTQPIVPGIQIPPPPAAPGHESLSQTAAHPKQISSASLPSPAAPCSQNPPVLPVPVALGDQSPTVRPPLPAAPAPGNKSQPVTKFGQYYQRKAPIRPAPGEQSQLTPSPPTAPVQPLPPAAPSNQSLPPPTEPGKQSPPAPIAPSNQSPPAPIAPSNQSPPPPTTAPGKQSPPQPTATSSRSPPPLAHDNQSRSAE